MKLIYAQGFNKNERLDFKPVIFNNIIQSFRTIAEAMGELGIEYEFPDNEVGYHLPALPFPSSRTTRVTPSCPYASQCVSLAVSVLRGLQMGCYL